MAQRFEGFIVASTARAILFQGHYFHHPHWLPRSQIEILPTEDFMETVIDASEWISRMKGLREFTEHEHEPEPF